MTIWFTKSFKKAFLSGVFVTGIIALWSLITYRASFLHFFVGHKSYDPMLSEKNLLFEFNSWLHYYSINLSVASSLLLLAILGAIKNYKQPAAVFSIFNTLFAFFVLALSTTNEERHFMVAIPGILFLSGLGTHFLFRKIPSAAVATVSFAILGFFCFNFDQKAPEIRSQLQSQYEGEAGFAGLFQFIYDQTGPGTPVLIYGISDSFSIEALRWYFAKNSRLKYTDIKIDAYPYRDDKNFTAKMRRRNIDKPYESPGFPKKPLSEILAKAYYGFTVHVLNKEVDPNNKSKRQRFSKEGDELKEMLTPKLINKSAAGSHEIEVYKTL